MNAGRDMLDTVVEKMIIATQVQAPRCVCRFCDGRRGHSCLMPDGHGCHWIDARKTICSNPECVAKYNALRIDALRALVSNKCVCGERKTRKMAFCKACFDLLPWIMSSELYAPMDRGFACYYNEAVAAWKQLSAKEGRHVR
jgi:hypothetical protein